MHVSFKAIMKSTKEKSQLAIYFCQFERHIKSFCDIHLIHKLKHTKLLKIDYGISARLSKIIKDFFAVLECRKYCLTYHNGAVTAYIVYIVTVCEINCFREVRTLTYYLNFDRLCIIITTGNVSQGSYETLNFCMSIFSCMCDYEIWM